MQMESPDVTSGVDFLALGFPGLPLFQPTPIARLVITSTILENSWPFVLGRDQRENRIGRFTRVPILRLQYMERPNEFERFGHDRCHLRYRLKVRTTLPQQVLRISSGLIAPRTNRRKGNKLRR
jgi:hypothetical protein